MVMTAIEGAAQRRGIFGIFDRAPDPITEIKEFLRILRHPVDGVEGVELNEGKLAELHEKVASSGGEGRPVFGRITEGDRERDYCLGLGDFEQLLKGEGRIPGILLSYKNYWSFGDQIESSADVVNLAREQFSEYIINSGNR